MLCLTRNVSDAGVNIYGPDGRLVGRVVLVEVNGGQRARIGFEFDDDYNIVRGEVDDQSDDWRTAKAKDRADKRRERRQP